MDYNPSSLTVVAIATPATVKEANTLGSGTKTNITTVVVSEDTFSKVKAEVNSITYASQDPTIATVSSTGEVTGVKAGTTKIVVTATDMFGNTITKEVDITVNSNKLPELTLSTATATLEVGDAFDPRSYITSATDVEDTALATSDVVITNLTDALVDKNNKLNDTGSFTLKYKVTDSDGNSVEKQIAFTVEDKTVPTFTTSTKELILELGAADKYTVADVAALLSDVVIDDNNPNSLPMTIQAKNFGDIKQDEVDTVGKKVVFFVTDAAGLETKQEVLVKVEDTTAPTFDVENKTVTIEASENIDLDAFVTKYLGTITNTDNDKAYAGQIESTAFASLDQTKVDKTGKDIILTVKDASNNPSSVTVKVKVGDTQAPTLSKTKDDYVLEVGKTIGLADLISASGVTASDNDKGSTLEIKSDNFTKLKQDEVNKNGTTVILYVADNSGYKATTDVVVKVVDTTDPKFTIEKNKARLELGKNSTLQDVIDQLGTITKSDNDLASTNSMDITSAEFGSINLDEPSVTTIYVTVTDKSGNFTSLPVELTVSDTTKPTFDVEKKDITIEAGVVTTAAELESLLGKITIEDNDPAMVKTIDYSDFAKVDQTRVDKVGKDVTLTVTDPTGNKKSVTIKVKVEDTTVPTLTVDTKEYVLEVGDTITLADLTTALNAVSNDNDEGSKPLEVKSADFKDLKQGVVNEDGTKVTLYVEDKAGLTATVEVTVKVVDTTDPEFTIENDEARLELSSDSTLQDVLDQLGTITKSDNDPASTDDLEITSVDFKDIDLDVVDETGTVITLTVTDKTGNSTSLSVTVTVTDTTDPTFEVENETVEFEVNTEVTYEDFLKAVNVTKAEDNDVLADVNVKATNFADLDTSVIKDGTVITLYVTDPTGNTTSIDITVNVIDTTAPVVDSDLVTISYRAESEVTEAEFFEQIGLVVSDNSLLAPTVTSDFAKVDFNPEDLKEIKPFLVTITVTDSVDNVTTKTVQVNIVRKALYYIEGNDITLEMSELTSHIEDGTVEAFIINKAGAKAWKDDYLDGITDLPVYIKNMDALKNAKAGEDVILDLVLTSPTSAKAARMLVSEEDLEVVVGQVKVTIKEEVKANPSTPGKDKDKDTSGDPATGVNLSSTINEMMALLLISLAGIAIFTRRRRTNK
ncbi:Ig-like protein group 2 [Breznakia blatticola]|uniref:Ig-like protein group 2 n=1 Tax=Breznakia blatticola TaxID=1754012 RepID=A0A4R7ZTX4_9FIRM|nr:LapB repeat-containing protein [Breznakia blatticola]TDW20208.1 Ig-like protein group 2 [Breznakia blatticola]